MEQFLKVTKEEEKADFFHLVKTGNIGISATYLNFNDLVDSNMLDRKTAKMQKMFQAENISIKTAMNADINGISMGARDVLIKNGIEFLFTNIHTHHGMYPLYQNQIPYFWENENRNRILVWSGEHYNLGNALGIVFNKNTNFMTESYFGKDANVTALDALHTKLSESITEYETSGYPYDFYITSVSGVFSDNAPANPNIVTTINAFNQCFGEEVILRMVTLQELYMLIREKVTDAPVYRGSMNDWWGNGVGSTPYAVKHYKEGLRLAHICDALEKKTNYCNEKLREIGEENALLYAEHTWGHSATITNPYDTMVTNLDIRKTSYASKVHEANAMRKSEQYHLMGDILRYYHTKGQVKAVSVSCKKGTFPVEFYIETMSLSAVKVTDTKTNKTMQTQISPHPRGVLISFLAEFEPMEERIFTYEEQTPLSQNLYTRTAWIGAERVRDIVNNYDQESYQLPYRLENNWFRIRYQIGQGVVSFQNKKDGAELLKEGFEKFLTPLYECTKIRNGIYEERRLLGRNIRGLHAMQYQGVLQEIKILDHGLVFDRVELVFELEGTYHSSVIIKMYRRLPRLEFTYRIAKTLSEDIESIYLPLSLNLPESTLYIHNGGVAMRPGIDQLPGSNMEYYMTDQGVLYQKELQGILLNSFDVPLIYMGQMQHHPILLCDNKEQNNHRPVYSWIMNNTWETNFKMDLSGFGEFRYSLELREGSLTENLQQLQQNDMGVLAFIVGE
ncbi:hypothetical protein IMSAGC011_03327 [Lachnospiraceae bacterium]|nr:hypothetical protein IMSAGC011_03327 [Lachnospiraceae bacterium]